MNGNGHSVQTRAIIFIVSYFQVVYQRLIAGYEYKLITV